MEKSKIDSVGKFVTGGFDRQWQWKGSEGVKNLIFLQIQKYTGRLKIQSILWKSFSLSLSPLLAHPDTRPGPCIPIVLFFSAKDLCFQIFLLLFCFKNFCLKIFCLKIFCLSTPFLFSPSVLSGVDHFRFLEKAQIPQESRAREYRNDLHPPGASFSTIWKLYIGMISVHGPLFQPFENDFKLCNFCNSLKLKFQTRCQHL